MRGHRDLKVFQLAYKLAMEIFNESKSFPKEERYSLTDQIRRFFTQRGHEYSRRVS
jgi:23S rRNA-intervening sequence protein